MSAERAREEFDESAFEDDDATMGRSRPVNGMMLPNLTEEDKKYLDGAVSDQDFMARMTTIAHRIDAARKRTNLSRGMLGPDEYVESLSRPPPDLSGKDFRSTGANASDDYMDSLKKTQPRSEELYKDYNARGTNEGEEYIRQLSSARHKPQQSNQRDDESTKRVQDLQAHLRERADVNPEDLQPETMPDPAALDAQIAELHEKLRKAAGETEADSQPTSTPSADAEALDTQIAAMEQQLEAANGDAASEGDASVVDKQINALEGYLSKLKQEEEDTQKSLMKERLSGTMEDLSRDVDTGPRFDEFGNAPGEMSEQEKMEAFEAIRRQAMMRQQQMQDELADPLAKPLPQSRPPGAREDDNDADFGRTDMGMTDADFVVSELEAEVKKYFFDAKQLLNDHEIRMKSLLEKLREL